MQGSDRGSRDGSWPSPWVVHLVTGQRPASISHFSADQMFDLRSGRWVAVPDPWPWLSLQRRGGADAGSCIGL